jgi:hypothetical protein
MTDTKFEPSNVNAYVDLFSLHRPGVRADLDAGKVGGFTVNR